MLHSSGKALTPPCDEQDPATLHRQEKRVPWDNENGPLPPVVFQHKKPHEPTKPYAFQLT